MEVLIAFDKAAKETKISGASTMRTTTLAVRVEGRSYTDLLKEMKTKIKKEDAGEIYC